MSKVMTQIIKPCLHGSKSNHDFQVTWVKDLHTTVIPNKPNQHSMERLKEINGELLMIWGKQDNHIPDAGRKTVYEKMLDAKLKFTWHEFNGQHAFMRDEGERYDPELALLGYELALKLFQRKLT